MLVALLCGLSVVVALAAGHYPMGDLAALAAVAVLLAASSPCLLSPMRRGWWGGRSALAAWQLLAASGVFVCASHPAEMARMPSDYVLCAAGAVTAWRADVAGHGGMAALLAGAATVHVPVFGVGTAVSSILFELFVYGLMVAVFQIVTVTAQRTDREIARLARAERMALAAGAVRRDRMARMRVLHDTVLATLTAVARGFVHPGPAARARFAADLDRLSRPHLLGAPSPDRCAGVDTAAVCDLLEGVVRDSEAFGLCVRLRHRGAGTGRLAATAVGALVGGTAEALANVRTHAGVTTADVVVQWSEHEVVVLVEDAGCGFDPALVSRRIGLAQSLGSRVADAGGVVDVRSAPGAGTRVEIRVPLLRPDSASVEAG